LYHLEVDAQTLQNFHINSMEDYHLALILKFLRAHTTIQHTTVISLSYQISLLPPLLVSHFILPLTNAPSIYHANEVQSHPILNTPNHP
jgi:hypothetical protein